MFAGCNRRGSFPRLSSSDGKQGSISCLVFFTITSTDNAILLTSESDDKAKSFSKVDQELVPIDIQEAFTVFDNVSMNVTSVSISFMIFSNKSGRKWFYNAVRASPCDDEPWREND